VRIAGIVRKHCGRGICNVVGQQAREGALDDPGVLARILSSETL
jgi:hypothetical protein